MKEVVILSAIRTPIGSFQGAFKDVSAPHLGAAAIKEALRQSGVKPEQVDECLMGNVLTAGIGQAPARQAALYAGLPEKVRCTTVSKVCGSGLKAVMLASQAIQAGDSDIVIAGGMENMTRAPFLLDRGREGYRLGHGKVLDSMILDGLWDPYGDKHMGNCGELCAKEGSYSRAEQDRFAAQSYRRALSAINEGKFKKEIAVVEIPDRKGPKKIDTDEEPGRGQIEKFPELKPAFQKDGTITAANASSINDGAAALVVTSADLARTNGWKPIARIVAQAQHAQAPEWFTTAPVGAIQNVLKKAQLTKDAIDFYEINEAFSVVALACAKQLGISEDKLNVRGGAVALGHPIGASGARILTSLIHTLRDEKKKLGVAGICIGGGEAAAVVIEAIY